MFDEILAGLALILALYGLTCVISSVAVWLMTPGDKRHYWMVAVLEDRDEPETVINGLLQRLANSGMGRKVAVIAVNHGLCPEKESRAERFCKREKIILCKPDELSEIFHLSSFHREENTV